jgi:hypothetical protein
MSGRTGRAWVLVPGAFGPLVAGAVSDVAWSTVVVAGGADEFVASAALAVSGVAVIVLLWLQG